VNKILQQLTKTKRKLIVRVFFILVIVNNLYSCKKEIKYAELTGTLKGKVWTYPDAYIVNPTHEGVIVEVIKNGVPISTTTDANGIFMLNDLKTGYYNLVLSKSGYATKKHLNFQFVGGDLPTYLNSSIREFSQTKITNLSATLFDSLVFGYKQEGFIRIRCNISGNLIPKRHIKFCLGESNTENFDHYWEMDYVTEMNGLIDTTISQYKFVNIYTSITQSDLYIFAYDNTYYYDNANGDTTKTRIIKR